MRARRVPVRRLSCLSAAVVGLATLVSPQPAAAVALEHAWEVCSGDNMAPQARLAQCTTIIESGAYKRGDLAIALVNRGFARSALENYAGAIADYDEAEKHSPTLGWIPSNRGFAWLNSNDPEHALADFNRALELNPNESRIYWGRALAYQRLNDSERAIADLNEAVRLAPRAVEPRLARAELYIQAGQRERAIADYKVAIAIDPANQGAYEALRDSGIKVAEVSPTAACSAPDVTPQERVDACTALIESGSAEGRALAIAYGNRGRALSLLKQYDRALADLDDAIRMEPHYPIAFSARAQIRALKNDRNGAIADFTRAIELEPDSVGPYLNRALIFAQLGAFDRVLVDTTAVIDREPSSVNALIMRAGAHYRMKNLDAAIADITHGLAVQPKSARLHSIRAYYYYNQKLYTQAIEDYSASIVAEPSALTYAARASTYEDVGQRDRAIADYQKALALNPDLDSARRALDRLHAPPPPNAALPPGDCVSNDVPLEQRIAGCASVIAGGKLTGWTLRTAHCNMAYWLTDAQQYDRVIEASNAALKIDASWACAYNNRGRGWYFKHDFDRALADYNETLRLDPQFHEAFANRGTLHFDRKEFAEAIADYDRAIAIEPSVAMYVSDRGNTRFNMGDYDRAVADQTRALAIDPDYVGAYLRRGWALIRKQDYALAEADFAKALELAPGDQAATAGLQQAREYRRHPAYAAQDREAREKGLSFEHFRQLLDQPQAPPP